MPNIFLCIAWPLIIALPIVAYKFLKKKNFKVVTAVILAGLIGIIVAIASANGIAMIYSPGKFSILSHLEFLFAIWLPG